MLKQQHRIAELKGKGLTTGPRWVREVGSVGGGVSTVMMPALLSTAVDTGSLGTGAGAVFTGSCPWSCSRHAILSLCFCIPAACPRWPSKSPPSNKGKETIYNKVTPLPRYAQTVTATFGGVAH
jgi:hypothetical protein